MVAAYTSGSAARKKTSPPCALAVAVGESGTKITTVVGGWRRRASAVPEFQIARHRFGAPGPQPAPLLDGPPAIRGGEHPGLYLGVGVFIVVRPRGAVAACLGIEGGLLGDHPTPTLLRFGAHFHCADPAV